MTHAPEAKEDAVQEPWETPKIDLPPPDPGADPKRVALVGKGKNRYGAPWGQQGWELWGLNDRSPYEPPIEAFTRWFQLHPPKYLRVHYQEGIDDLDANWREERGVRLYMDRHYRRYPDSEPYPKDEVEALTPRGWYHASSFDWMLALAVLEGFEVIDLYGCGFTTFPYLNGEPISGRACLEYWAGVAEGRGAVVRQYSGGDLFQVLHLARMRSKLQYGFQDEPALDLSLTTPWVDLR